MTVPQIEVIQQVFSDIKDRSLIKVVSEYDLNKPNNYFEYLDPERPTHPFIDLDNSKAFEDNPIDNEDDFKNAVLRIEKKLINRYPSLSLLNASHFKSQKWNKDNTLKKIEPKISFRLTDHTKICNNMTDCRDYCLGTFKEEIQECLGDDFALLNIDSAVYRKNSGGKMSCVNAYKHYQQKSRTRQIVNGEIKHTFIQCVFGDEEVVTPVIREKPKPKPKPKQKQIVKSKLTNEVIEVENVSEELIQ